MKPFEELFFKAGPDCSPGPAFSSALGMRSI